MVFVWVTAVSQIQLKTASSFQAQNKYFLFLKLSLVYEQMIFENGPRQVCGVSQYAILPKMILSTGISRLPKAPLSNAW